MNILNKLALIGCGPGLANFQSSLRDFLSLESKVPSRVSKLAEQMAFDDVTC
jgi:hypothetical protein